MGVNNINTEFQLTNAASEDVNLIYKGIPLHSNENPQQEAVEEFKKAGQSKIIVIIGLGLGYLLKRVFISSNSKIIVFEPDRELSDFTLRAVDFNQELQSGRVFIASSYEELSKTIESIYQYKDKLSVLKLKSADLLYPGQIKNISLELPKLLNNLESNFTTLYARSWLWLLNGYSKLRFCENDYSINILEGKYKDKAALIVSPGPSLDKNIEIIKNNREKFIVFCVNVAYKKLIKNSIVPDFIVYLDGTDNLYTIKDFEHSQANIIKHSLAYGKITDELSPNKFFTFYCKNDLISRWIAKQTVFSLENHETKGSVSHLALQAAYNMGCNPIVLAGQDLAYTDGKVYSSGSYWGENAEKNENFEKKMKKMQETSVLKVKGQDGELIDTSPDYAGFISHFEEFALQNKDKVELINCSTDGAQLNGYENKGFQDTANELEPVGINIRESLNEIIKQEKDPFRENYYKIQEQIKLFACEAQKTLTLAEKGLKYSKSLEQELKKRQLNPAKIGQLANKIIKTFDEIDGKFFKKWEFSIYIALKELNDFYEVLDNQSGKDDASMLFELAKTSRNFFSISFQRLRNTVNEQLPLILN